MSRLDDAFNQKLRHIDATSNAIWEIALGVSPSSFSSNYSLPIEKQKRLETALASSEQTANKIS
jgi:hypothetical protein